MRADTEQLRRAEQELLSQLAALDRIIRQVDDIGKQVRQFSSLDEISGSLQSWGRQMDEYRTQQLRYIMALDSICRIYESCERRIEDYSENTGRRDASAIPQWNKIPRKYTTAFQKLGGGKT